MILLLFLVSCAQQNKKAEPETLNNLVTAIEGELIANAKYWKYADMAMNDSLPKIAAMFRASAVAEKAHADRQILQTLKRRLERETVRMACLNCDSSVRRRIMDLGETVECTFCGGKMVAALNMRSDSHKLLKKRRKSGLGEEDLKDLGKLKKNANIILAHGKRGALVLAARGVGPQTAMRILRKPYDTEEQFLREILKAEVHFAKTKRFWDGCIFCFIYLHLDFLSGIFL